MNVSAPVVNAGNIYINGLQLSFLTGTTIQVNAGMCRDSTNTNDIIVGLPLNVAATDTGVEPVAAGTGPVVINAAVNGAAGLDVGALANNTFYAVYAIGDSYGLQPGSALISANLVAPQLPFGYNMFFRIGYVKTSGAAAILSFRQDGASLDRWMWYDAALPTSVTAGSSATYAPVDATGALPTGAPTMVIWAVEFTPTGAGNSLVLVPGLSSSAGGYAFASGSVAGVAVATILMTPTDSPITDAINYKVTGSAVSIDVIAYLDQL